MKLIIRSFGKELNDEFPVIQDGDYAIMMDSASLSHLVVPFGNYHCFKTNFLLPLKVARLAKSMI